MNTYTPIIGLEIHVELATASKMFCGCPNNPFYAEKPNMYTCPVCLGLPGGLPVPNKKAIEWTIKLGLALGCEINLLSKFDRKNYFYPDLPKGYQISQYDMPFCKNGKVVINGKTVRITRVHLEEDTGKLIHSAVDGEKATLVDFNRSGVPLVEIVTEPDIRSGDEAKAFLKKLHQIVRYLEISGADMEKGSMRLEPNISVKKDISSPRVEAGRQTSPFAKATADKSAIRPEELPKYKVEVKNINSFQFVKKAIDYEIERHIKLLEQGETPKQETRGYVESTGSTVSQRSKEDANDYRYFPEPDIPPIVLTQEKITAIRQTLPELPDEKAGRFQKTWNVTKLDAESLTETKDQADFFEACIALIEADDTYKKITPGALVNALINRKKDGTTVTPSDLLSSIQKKLDDMAVPPEIMNSVITEIIKNNQKAVTDYQTGKTGVLMFLVGQVKKELKGKGDAEIIKKELEKFIKL